MVSRCSVVVIANTVAGIAIKKQGGEILLEFTPSFFVIMLSEKERSV